MKATDRHGWRDRASRWDRTCMSRCVSAIHIDFGATRNPELWMRPFRNYGTLAGRVTDANGNIAVSA